MTVGELIKELGKYDETLLVMVPCPGEYSLGDATITGCDEFLSIEGE